MDYFLYSAIYFVILFHSHLAEAALTLSGPKCGEKRCDINQYCSRLDSFCKPCSNICDNKSHNYEEAECIKDCQDYLHDLIYVRRNGSNEDLRAMVQKLQAMLAVTLTLVCFVLITIGIFVTVRICRWKRKKNITISTLYRKLFVKKTTDDTNKPTPSNLSTNGKTDLRLDLPIHRTQSDHSPVTATTTISRRPAEDSALDYAYDNPAMSSTPPNVKPHESSF